MDKHHCRDAPPLHGRFWLRADHTKKEVACATRQTDYQLGKKCQQWKRVRERAWEEIGNISCPSAASSPADDAAMLALDKYGKRSGDGSGCEAQSAEWKENLGPFHKCVLVTVADHLHLRPGERKE